MVASGRPCVRAAEGGCDLAGKRGGNTPLSDLGRLSVASSLLVEWSIESEGEIPLCCRLPLASKCPPGDDLLSRWHRGRDLKALGLVRLTPDRPLSP
jgi:hypothetical protein